MDYNENFAIKEQFFYNWRIWAFLLIPIYTGAITVISSSFGGSGFNNFRTLYVFRSSAIDNLIRIFRVTSFLHILLLIQFTWGKDISSGKYGYWLAQGLERKNFHFLLTTYLNLINLFTSTLSVMFFSYLTGFYLNSLLIGKLIILLFISNSITIHLSFLLKEVIRSPELSIFFHLIIFWLITTFLNVTSILSKMLVIEKLWESINLFPVFMAVLLSIILNYLSYRLHIRRDIKL